MSDEDPRELSAAQAAGFTDMAPDEFRRAAHQVVDMIADYLEHVEDFAVLPAVEPGSLRPLFPSAPPDEPEPLDAILGDVEALIEPNVTHWQHPGFFGWFATTASGAGMLGEFLTAGLGSNAMLWRASPVATELEQVVVDWLRQALGLPEAFDGLLTDTASTSTLIALAAAREAAGLEVAAMGLAGRPDVPPPVVYTSTEANLSVEKACMTLGIGRANVRRIPPDEAYRMDVGALAVAIADDRVAGRRPIAIVPTIGTTSTTSVDPVAAIVDLAERERIVGARGCRVCRRGRADPGAARAVRGLGTRRFRHDESAQVAVHAARRIGAVDPANGPGAGGIQPRARVPGRPRARVAGARLQRVHAAARAPVPGAEAVDSAALVRPRRASTSHRATHRLRAGVRGLGRRRPGLRGAGAGSVLDRLLPVSARWPRLERRRGRLCGTGARGAQRAHSRTP